MGNRAGGVQPLFCSGKQHRERVFYMRSSWARKVARMNRRRPNPDPARHTPAENRSCAVIIDVVGRGNGTDFSESLVAEKFAILKNNVESVSQRDGLIVDDFAGAEFFAVVDQVEAATFPSFAWID